jgi:hypothetical protein
MKYIKWSFIVMVSLLSVLIIYSWIVVAVYKELPLQAYKTTSNYSEYCGVVHIHTKYSDGAGTPEEVREAAQQAALDFIAISDHDSMGSFGLLNNSQKPVVISGIEISTDAGHLLSLGVNDKIDKVPVHAQDAIDLVKVMNGLPVIAHPVREKTRWTNWNVTGYSGIEVLNQNSILSQLTHTQILFLLPEFLMNQKGSLTAITDFPAENISLWNGLNTYQRIIGYYSADTHGPAILGVPAYKNVFSTAKIHLVTHEKKNNNITPERIKELLSKGSFYMAIDGIARSNYIDFRITRNSEGIRYLGEVLDTIESNDKLQFDGAIPKGAQVNLIRNGKKFMSFNNPHFDIPLKNAGFYRIEIVIPKEFNPYGKDKIWLITNHIYVLNESKL